ncbi:MAG TPA: TlpA disulfide reductase family protein [Pyrinomonadaceae bacterium]|nr:TlpA disulfide reductase family protein [Pyrinomonadaceae bacterium]
MRTRLVLIFAGVCALFLLSCNSRPGKNDPVVVSQPPPTNLPMPPLKSANSNIGWVANNKHFKLADSRNKVVILDFYATWCVPCRDSIPHLVDLHRRYNNKGLEIVGLNVGGEDDYEQVPAFASEFQIPYQLGIPDVELESLYMSDENAIPQTFVLDRNGVVVKRFIGYDDSMADELDSIVKSALDKTN